MAPSRIISCPWRRVLAIVSLLLLTASSAFSSTRSFLLVHTGDIHDHLRSGYIGIGGLTYISGYIQQVRAERDDVLLVDIGDVLEKGDLIAHRTFGDVSYEAMARIGFDALTIGNHDHDFGLVGLRRYEEILGQRFLVLNLVNPAGEPYFEPSRIVEVNGIQIGLIGMLAPRKSHFGGLDHEASGRALAEEADRLKQEVDVVIALCHQGTRYLREWSAMAPAVDVMVAGHHHETLLEPMVVEETGAILVGVGADAHWVGHLELEVDLEKKRVVSHDGRLVLMRHDTIPADEEMIAWLRAKEEELAPEANEFIIDLEAPVGWFALGRLISEAIRHYADADIAFYHPTQIIRNSLPAGRIDYNALFRVSADRVDPLLRLQMTGEEISYYMDGLSMSDWGQTQWAGFSVEVQEKGDGKSIYTNNLDPERLYTVMVAEREWERYMIGLFDPAYVRSLYGSRFPNPAPGEPLPRRNFPGEPVSYPSTEALAAYLREVASTDESLHERLAHLQKKQGGVDPNEARIEPRFLRSVSPEYYLEMEASVAR